MLRTLGIRDFVIVERLDLEFQGGFTVLTGETGAGKSILIDALALVLGERSDAGLVRGGAARAEISAEFGLDDLAQVRAWLQANDLAEESDQCLLRRVLEAGGRSRAYVNGRPATIAQLKELSQMLVDIHGQHEHQSLLRPAAQRELLDAFAGASALARETALAWQARQALHRQRLDWEQNAQAMAAERERLEWQRRELERLAFRAQDWDELQRDHQRLSHAAALIEAVESALDVLSEGEAAALAQVDATLARLADAVQFDSSLKEPLDMLGPARIQMQEAVYGLRRYRNRVELDPRRLREVEQRLEAIHSTARRLRVAPEQLPEVLAESVARLDQLGGGAGPEALAQREQAAQARYAAHAARLSAERVRAAGELSRRVSEQMQNLAMAGGRFEVSLARLTEPAQHGVEQVEFLVATDPGAALRPLAKVASGGELSRVSLAIQSVTSAVALVPTLVFDEVDAGIGGRVAEIVGRMLCALGKKHQVMCITHLPQVAAAADRQWQVTKTASATGVRSLVRELDAHGRVEELARMLGGARITPTTRKHAAELLEGATQTSDQKP